MSASSLASGLCADRLGPVTATLGPAALCARWALGWNAATWRLWQGPPEGPGFVIN